MSDDSVDLSVDVGAEVDAPAEGGQGSTEAPPEREYLPDEYTSRYVRVKVDGEDQEVPLSEALGGYQRQADYTRKTQELARQAQEQQFAITLQRALENNPQQTLRILQEQYGIGDPTAAQAADEVEDEWEDPEETRWREVDQRLNRWEEYQAAQELQHTLGVLSQRYGEDFDPQAVVTRATQMGRMDLENVFKEMAFEKYWVQQRAQQDLAQRTGAEDASRQAAKAGLTMHGGSGVGGNGAVAEQTGTATSISEAYYQAKRQLGL